MPYFVCSFKLSTVTKYALFTYILDFHFSISAILFLLNIYVSTLQPMTMYVRFVTSHFGYHSSACLVCFFSSCTIKLECDKINGQCKIKCQSYVRFVQSGKKII